MMGSLSDPLSYSPVKEAERIFGLLCDQAELLSLPSNFPEIKKNIVFETDSDRVYFPIPFKETETASALKAVEGGVASALAELKGQRRDREIKVDLEKATLFLFQSYLATVGGLGKQDEGVKAKLKGMELILSKSCSMLISPRYRSSACTVRSISTNVGKSLRSKGPRSILPYSWLTRSQYPTESDWPGAFQARLKRPR